MVCESRKGGGKRMNASAKNIDQDPPAQSAQADLGRNFCFNPHNDTF